MIFCMVALAIYMVCLHLTRHEDHPEHPETVHDHAEAGGEEGLAQGGVHLAAVRKCREPLFRLGFRRDH